MSTDEEQQNNEQDEPEIMLEELKLILEGEVSASLEEGGWSSDEEGKNLPWSVPENTALGAEISYEADYEGALNARLAEQPLEEDDSELLDIEGFEEDSTGSITGKETGLTGLTVEFYDEDENVYHSPTMPLKIHESSDQEDYEEETTPEDEEYQEEPEEPVDDTEEQDVSETEPEPEPEQEETEEHEPEDDTEELEDDAEEDQDEPHYTGIEFGDIGAKQYEKVKEDIIFGEDEIILNEEYDLEDLSGILSGGRKYVAGGAAAGGAGGLAYAAGATALGPLGILAGIGLATYGMIKENHLRGDVEEEIEEEYESLLEDHGEKEIVYAD